MNSLDANTRDNKSKGQLNAIRKNGDVPAIVYGGKDENQKISISKKLLKVLIEKENFLSNIITLNVNGKPQNVLPREVKYHIINDEPTHVDFLRVLPGVNIKIEVPVNFINHEKSPGLKRGGVLNIVRRKVELKCPSEKIPESLTLDLDGIDIGESFKISSVKLEPEVTPTIQGRDFVIATLAAPTVMKEPEKPAEVEAAEGEEGTEGAEGSTTAAADGDKPAADGAKVDKKESDDKKAPEKKPSEEKKK
jgi:large subunit ribosomal protein L25